jgi:adenylate cyclase class 2
MMTAYTETEIKLYVPDHAPVIAALESAGAVVSAERVLERNTRYDTPEQALRARHAVLRLRADTRVRLTYKDGERQAEAFGTTRFEAEVDVSNFDVMEVILGRLGYVPVMGYEKYRTTYVLYDTEITLDEMPYGNFVEIEGQSAAIGRVIERLGLRDAVVMRASYVVLFENVRRNLGLSFTDLTFENFTGIDVPLRAFNADET